MYVEGSSGKNLDVTSDGRAKAQTLDEISNKARASNSLTFMNGMKLVNNATAATVILLHIKNTDSSRLLVIDKIEFSCSASGNVYVSGVHTYSSGGTAVDFNNSNRGSNNSFDILGYRKQDSTLMTVAGTAVNFKMSKCAANTPIIFDMKDALILTQNKTVSIRFKGAGSENFGISVSGYMEELS